MKIKNIKKLTVILKILEKENLQIIFSIIILAIFIPNYGRKSLNWESLLDLKIIISFLILYIFKLLSELISRILINRIEDYTKLERNYNSLIKRYPLERNFVIYKNESNKSNEKYRSSVESKIYNNEEDKYIFPVVIVEEMKNKQINIIDDKNKEYNQPEFVRKNFYNLISAHSTSSLYNQTNIRLDKIIKEDKIVNLYTSRTKYYDSLVTNRAMDFKLKNDLSVREALNPGPFIDPLEKSLLSNHIGFNIYVKTKDDKIIFIERNMNVSIGKGTLGSSVAASLKTRYCLDKNYNFSMEGMKKAVIEEMVDELGIKMDDDFSIEKNLIIIYRDLIEGGKPQFLFYVELNKDEGEVRRLFEENKKINDPKYETIIDGDKMVFLDLNNKEGLYIAPDIIFIDNKKYPVLPSVSGTLVYLLNYLKAK